MPVRNIDRTRDLVVLAPRRVSGELLVVGKLLTDDQKSQLTTRTLNLFASNKWIAYADESERPKRIGSIERIRRQPQAVVAAPEDGQRPDDGEPQREDVEVPENEEPDQLEFKPTEERKKPRRKVKIPAEWRELDWNDRRSLAAKLTDEPVKSKADVERAINAELSIRTHLKGS